MPTLTIARNPDPASRLPFLLRLPVQDEGDVVLACREAWPEGRDAYCHALDAWPEGAEVIDEVPVASCRRQGAAIHLVLQRRQRRRSMFVWTRKGERTLIFWRTAKTMSAARPGLKVPAARGLDAPLDIAVDVGERYAWAFRGQRATLTRRSLPIGDYGVLDDAGRLVAAVERKQPGEVASRAVGGTLGLALAELATLPRALLIVEGRLSDVLKAPEGHVDAGWLMSALAALQAEQPAVPWLFADNRRLAEDYAYRWLAAAARLAAPASASTPGDAGRAQRPLPLGDPPDRRAAALAEARAGRAWTGADYAARFGVSRATALADLNALVAAGALRAEGATRSRRYLTSDDGGGT